MKCVYCKKVEVQKAAPDFPFCSERCRLLDLGAWASEKYVISSPAQGPGKPLDDTEEERD